MIRNRLMSFAELSAGWLEGCGKAVPVAGLEWLADQFAKHGSGIPRPFLFPTESGGVQAEWLIGTDEISLEIDLETHFALWDQLDTVSRIGRAEIIDLGSEAGWSKLKWEFGLVSPQLRSEWPYKTDQA